MAFSDNEARDVLLRRAYELRHIGRMLGMSDYDDIGLERNTLANILEQLCQLGLVEWTPFNPLSGPQAGQSKITAAGVDRIESALRTEPSAVGLSARGSVRAQGRATPTVQVLEPQNSTEEAVSLDVVQFEGAKPTDVAEATTERASGGGTAARTRIGKDLLTHQVQIAASTESLLILIDEKIESLRDQRLNSSEKIAQYEELKLSLKSFRDATCRSIPTSASWF